MPVPRYRMFLYGRGVAPLVRWRNKPCFSNLTDVRWWRRARRLDQGQFPRSILKRGNIAMLNVPHYIRFPICVYLKNLQIYEDTFFRFVQYLFVRSRFTQSQIDGRLHRQVRAQCTRVHSDDRQSRRCEYQYRGGLFAWL